MDVYTYRFMYLDHDSDECYVSIGASTIYDAIDRVKEHDSYFSVVSELVGTTDTVVSSMFDVELLKY